jgi:hypothetical protein
VDLSEFQRHSWESQSLVIPGSPGKFAFLAFDFERFAGALEGMEPGSIKASQVSPNGEGTYTTIPATDARACFDAGMTICVTGIDREVRQLDRLALATRATMGLAGEVLCNCYLSPAGTGFGMHFDVQSVFLLQVEGSKHWQFAARPSVAFPPEATDALPAHRLNEYRRRHPSASLDDPEHAPWLECDLHPGDLLYMPPGTWHRGRAGTYSLAITLTCCTHSFARELTVLLQQRLFGELAWRRNLPSAIRGSGDAGMPSEAASFVATRLAELRHLVAALRPEDFASAWHPRAGPEE